MMRFEIFFLGRPDVSEIGLRLQISAFIFSRIKYSTQIIHRLRAGGMGIVHQNFRDRDRRHYYQQETADQSPNQAAPPHIRPAFPSSLPYHPALLCPLYTLLVPYQEENFLFKPQTPSF
jgi:hypothetical protein